MNLSTKQKQTHRQREQVCDCLVGGAGRERNAVLGWSLKSDRTISVHSQGKPFNITIFQVYAQISNAEEAEVEQF